MEVSVNFYEVCSPIFEKPACQIIEKCYQTGIRTLVKVEDENMMELINKTLWTFSQKSFVPHGSKSDLFPELQPILITDEATNLNNSEILVSIASKVENIASFKRVIIIFSSDSKYQKDFCTKLFEEYKSTLTGVKYYKQTDSGTWIAI